MKNEECLICKKHYSQGGKCFWDKRNCLLFEEEPRGKMVRAEFRLDTRECDNPETPILKYGSKILIRDGSRDIEMEVISIDMIDLQTGMSVISAYYHENEAPKSELKKRFKVVN